MGQTSGSNERILTEAARWYARLGASDCTLEERARFERWLQRDPAHAEAYAASEAFAESVDRMASLDDRLQAMAEEAFEQSAHEQPAQEHLAAGRPAQRRWYVPASLAASVLVAFAGAHFIGLTKSSEAPAVAYSAPADARRDVMLADGSVVHLDVASEISVRMSSSKRDIVLVDGRALFEVAHDSSRPFTVAAGRSRTTALGTKFQVQREGQSVLVTLAEGSVAVSGDASPAPKWSEKLIPGEQISLTTDAQRGGKRNVDAQMATSWSRGRLAFRGTPLAEAIEEVNKYADRKIRLGDPQLAQMPVGGNFIAGETELIVSAFAAALPIRVVDAGSGEILLFRRYKTDLP
jgi:transmembrane sensor